MTSSVWGFNFPLLILWELDKSCEFGKKNIKENKTEFIGTIQGKTNKESNQLCVTSYSCLPVRSLMSI